MKMKLNLKRPEGMKADIHLETFTDASFAPGGAKSRSGVVIMMNGHVVHWTSKKQSIVTLSTCESEMLAQVTGMKLGLSIRQLMVELLGNERKVWMSLKGDNMAAMYSLQTEVSSWRTRHYSTFAAWIREKIEEYKVKLVHVPGKELVADGLTKLLGRILLEEFRRRIALQ